MLDILHYVIRRLQYLHDVLLHQTDAVDHVLQLLPVPVRSFCRVLLGAVVPGVLLIVLAHRVDLHQFRSQHRVVEE